MWGFCVFVSNHGYLCEDICFSLLFPCVNIIGLVSREEQFPSLLHNWHPTYTLPPSSFYALQGGGGSDEAFPVQTCPIAFPYWPLICSVILTSDIYFFALYIPRRANFLPISSKASTDAQRIWGPTTHEVLTYFWALLVILCPLRFYMVQNRKQIWICLPFL